MARFGPRPIPLEDRFWKKVDKCEDGCWRWTANKNNKGYGLIYCQRRKRKVLAHRVSWEIANGDIPDGKHVLHTCDNPRCVNPEHLFLGTHAENMRDMHGKGRGKYAAHRGESNGQSKMTWDKVRALRAAYAAGVPAADLATAFGVCKSNVGHIVSGRSWKE